MYLTKAAPFVFFFFCISCGRQVTPFDNAMSNDAGVEVEKQSAKVPQTPPASTPPKPKTMLEFALGFLKFAPDDANFCFSPYSLQHAFAMTYAGADGETKTEIEAVFGFSDEVHTNFQLSQQRYTTAEESVVQAANRLFIDSTVELVDPFQTMMKQHYGTDAKQLSFRTDPEGSRNDINQWVGKQTKGQIETLLPAGSITPLTQLALVNALTFEDRWQRPFSKEKTNANGLFYPSATVQKTLPMMKQIEVFKYAEDEFWQMVELPYLSDLSMVVLLPKPEVTVSTARAQLTSETLEAGLADLQAQKISLMLPQFKLDSTVPGKDMLLKMGLEKPFSVEQADFGKMTPHNDVVIEDVFHQTVVKVDEAGTKAAAATAVTMMKRSANVPPKTQVHVERPFVFLIHNAETKEILFIGQVIDPSI